MVDYLSIIYDWLINIVNWVVTIISWSYYLSPIRITILFYISIPKLKVKIRERTLMFAGSVIGLLPRVHVCMLLHSILDWSVFTVRDAILVKNVEVCSILSATSNNYDSKLVLEPILLRHPRVVHI